jgi:DHA1 family bicyclomycin/chloramphenicol resistance-like MFS transporter
VRSYLGLLRQPRLVGYALAGALNGAVLFTYIASSPSLLIGTYGISPGAFGWVFGLNAAGLIAAGQVNRILLRRLMPDEVLKVASVLAVAFAVALTLAAVSGVGGKWAVLSLLFALLSTYGFIPGNTMAGALNVDPLRSGSVSALMGAASFAAGALASSLTGLLHDGTARPMAYTMLVAMIGSALALRFMALKPEPQA